MTDVFQLLADPQGYEVAWDYCLENELSLPSSVTIPAWTAIIAGGSGGKSFAYSAGLRSGRSTSGCFGLRWSVTKLSGASFAGARKIYRSRTRSMN